MSEIIGSGKILILDDDRASQYELKKILVPEGYEVVLSNSYKEGEKYLNQLHIDLILMNIQIDERRGLAFLAELRKGNPHLPVIFLSSELPLGIIKKAIRLGIFDYINKPPDPVELIDSVGEAVSKYRQAQIDQVILKNSRQNLEELMTLLEVGKMTNSFDNVSLLLNRVIELVSQILDVETVSLMILHEDTQELIISAYIGLEKEIAETTRVPLGVGIAGWVAQQGKPLLINNLEKNENFKRFRKKSTNQYKTESLLCVPLKIKERVIGVLNVNNKKSGEVFGLHDLDLLKGISNSIALVIENARLYEKLQAKARELEQVNKELLQLDQMKSNFISNISHEVRTPLTSINGYAELLLEMKESLSSQEAQGFLQAIRESGRHLCTIFDQITEFSLIESGGIKLSMRPVPLHPLIKNVITRFQGKLREKKITLTYQSLSELLQVHADEEKISRVLYHFLDNAIKFNKENGEIRIRVEKFSQKPCLKEDLADFAKVSISDTGVGISKENLSLIFTKFTQLGNILTDKPTGVGLGLALCKEIVRSHQGKVGVESEPGKGSTFYFTLPLVAHGKK